MATLLNGTQAAIRAGYSPRTATEQGSQLLARLNIRARIYEAPAKQQAYQLLHNPSVRARIGGT
ncbi:MAG: terminase small subunit [Bacillota bacterium]